MAPCARISTPGRPHSGRRKPVQLDAAFQAAAGALLDGAQLHGVASLVADEHAAVHAFGGLALQGLHQVVLLEHVRPGVEQHVDRLAGAVEQLVPGVLRNRAPRAG